jgi:hypothetical protein
MKDRLCNGSPSECAPNQGGRDASGSGGVSVDRRINANYTNTDFGGNVAGHYDQRGIRVIVSATYVYGTFGFAGHLASTYAVPTDVVNIVIYPLSHQDFGGTEECKGFYPDPPPEPPCPYTSAQIENEIRRTFGHEAGHTVRICHRQGCTEVSDSQVTEVSLMNNRAQEGAPATDSRSQYDSFDVGRIRLHGR